MTYYKTEDEHSFTLPSGKRCHLVLPTHLSEEDYQAIDDLLRSRLKKERSKPTNGTAINLQVAQPVAALGNFDRLAVEAVRNAIMDNAVSG